MTSRTDVSTSKVCSWLTDFAGSPPSTGSGSMPPIARSTAHADLPESPFERIAWQRREVADRRTPNSRSDVARPLPTPHSRVIGSGARNAASSPGGTTTSPSGLPRSSAIFATNFVVATPTDAVSPSSRGSPP